jgi:hypothetical protein
MWKESMWAYEVKPGNGGREWHSLEQGLQSLLSMFASRQPTLREYQQRFKVSVFCGHFTSSFNGGPTLSPSLLEQLSDFGIELFLDTYSSDESASGT